MKHTSPDPATIAIKPILNAEEVAIYLSVCEKTVRTHTKSGLLPHVKIGRFIKYRRESIDKVLEELEIPATVEE